VIRHIPDPLMTLEQALEKLWECEDALWAEMQNAPGDTPPYQMTDWRDVDWPDGCKCDPASWESASVFAVPPICELHEGERFHYNNRCSLCGHLRECHEPGKEKL